MAKEEQEIDEELGYLDNYEEDPEEFKTIRKPLISANNKLKDVYDSRLYLLQKMEEIKTWFYEEIEQHTFLEDTPIVSKFENLLERYDEYKIKFEETIEIYNDVLKTVIEVVDNNYKHISEVGIEERRKIVEQREEIIKLKHKIKQIKLHYEFKINENLLIVDEWKKILGGIIKREEKNGKIDVDLLKDYVLYVDDGIDQSKKVLERKVVLKEENPDIKNYFKRITEAKDKGRQYSALLGVLTRQIKGGKIDKREGEYKKLALEKAWEMYQTSLKFNASSLIKPELDEQKKE